MSQFVLPALGAGLFGGLGFFGASSRNEAIEQNALNQQIAINDNIENLRLSFFDQSRIAAKRGQQRTGNLSNRLYNSFGSGHSLNRIIAAEVSDNRKDQASRKFALDRSIENLQVQKQNIANQASAQTSSPILGALSGALQGAQLGASLQSGIDSFQASQTQGEFMSGLEARLTVEGPPDPNALAQLRALQSGVPTSLLSSGGAIGQAVLQPFLTQINTEAFQAGALTNQVNFQRAQMQAAQQALYESQSLYQSYSQSLYGNINFNPYGNPLLGFMR